jgi:hypothetical protein
VKLPAYERSEQRKWVWLRAELKAGLKADEDKFVPLDANWIIAKAGKKKRSR